MDNVILLPTRLNRRALESHLRKIERVIPFLRLHLREASELPSKFHLDQTQASVQAIREALDYISYYLIIPPTAISRESAHNGQE